MVEEGLGSILNDAAETIGSGDDFLDGIAHFATRTQGRFSCSRTIHGNRPCVLRDLSFLF